MDRFEDKRAGPGSGVLRVARMACLIALAGLCGCAAVKPDREGPAGSPEGIRYDVTLAGVDGTAELKERLEGVSRLKSLQGEPPVTPAGLRRRLDDDIERFQSVLRSEGYYDASLQGRVEEGRTPVGVVVEVAPGPRYRLRSFTITYQAEEGRPPTGLPGKPADVGLEELGPARSETVLSAEAKLLEVLANSGRPLAVVKDRKAVVDHAGKAMDVTLQVDQGPPARFGGVTFWGLTDVQEGYIRRLIPWREGEPFDQRQLAEMDKRLYETELFESVVVQRADALAVGNALPTTVQVVERKHRSIGAAISYSTDEGPGGQVFWQHRNLFGQGEKLDLTAEASMIRQRLRADLTNPDYRRYEQDLLFSGEIARQDSEAFRSETATVTAGLRRKFSDTWSGRAGGSFEYGIVHDRSEISEGRTTYHLLGVPLALERDSRDDLLDPRRGSFLNLGMTPYLNTAEASDSFLDLMVGGSTYLALDDERRYVAAMRGRLESLLGAETRAIPATKRLYAGGGGSVRGYEFQTIGPLDPENDPIGGRSLAELGLEMRMRVGESFGIVPFVEGGLVGDSSVPDFGSTPQWAAGLGFRYFTAVGPLRADIAFPINRRREVDDLFQIYLSLGQSF